MKIGATQFCGYVMALDFRGKVRKGQELSSFEHELDNNVDK